MMTISEAIAIALQSYQTGNLSQAEEAIVCYQHAIALQPNVAEVYYPLGNALLEQGKYSEAIEQYQQAIALEPE